jgi:hypothetical protein
MSTLSANTDRGSFHAKRPHYRHGVRGHSVRGHAATPRDPELMVLIGLMFLGVLIMTLVVVAGTLIHRS